MSAVTADQMRYAHYVDELRLDIHRALKSAWRRDLWMRKARTYKAQGFSEGVLRCVAYAREVNRDVLLWKREAMRDMRDAR